MDAETPALSPRRELFCRHAAPGHSLTDHGPSGGPRIRRRRPTCAQASRPRSAPGWRPSGRRPTGTNRAFPVQNMTPAPICAPDSASCPAPPKVEWTG